VVEPDGSRAAAAAADEVTRLANRATMLTFLTAFALVVAAVTTPTLLGGGQAVFVRAAAALPAIGALLALTAVWRTRGALRAARSALRDAAAPAGERTAARGAEPATAPSGTGPPPALRGRALGSDGREPDPRPSA
jgi:hypothetical protein